MTVLQTERLVARNSLGLAISRFSVTLSKRKKMIEEDTLTYMCVYIYT